MINGVKIHKLTTHSDNRGFFREVLKINEDCNINDIGQISHSYVKKGVIKAWHVHKEQSQWNYVVCGLIQVVLFDLRRESTTYKQKMELFAGEANSIVAYYFPPLVAHGYKCLKDPLHIIYLTSGVYNPKEEYKLPPDDHVINFDWSAIK
jgi:dTDP-4-dehydrorhamnose 3,5-epimerase